MQATVTRGLNPPVWAIAAAVVVVVIATGAFLWTRDATVTRWHVPYQIVRGGDRYPLYDEHHCLSRTEAGAMHRVGSASGLPLYAGNGHYPETFFVQPEGYTCFMLYVGW